MPLKGPVRQEHIDAYKEGWFDEIPPELLKTVEDVVRRQTDRPVTQAEARDLPALPDDHDDQVHEAE